MSITREDAAPAGYLELRTQISNLEGLLMLSLLMTQSGDEAKIIHLSLSSVPSFCRCRLVGIYLSEGGWHTVPARPQIHAELAQLEKYRASLSPSGGDLELPGYDWCVALPLRGIDGHLGYFVAASEVKPSIGERFLLRVLAQQTGVALADARLHVTEQASTEALLQSNLALAESVKALEYAAQIHDRLTHVAAKGQGEEGIALALHELTGLPVAIEDRFGNMRAWAGPDCPDPYPKEAPATREAMLQRCIQAGEPIRHAGRMIAVANPRVDVLGVIALIDPHGSAGGQAKVALEHGSTVLAMELARLRSLAEADLRHRRDLVEELLSGTDQASALARAEALGHDLGRSHRVVIVEAQNKSCDMEKFFHGVRRAARSMNLGSLLVARASTVVIVTDNEVCGAVFRAAILPTIGGDPCRIGVGGWCERPEDIPRSNREAHLALKMQKRCGTESDTGVTFYDDLGVYRILAEVENQESVERFVRQWLAPLLSYDAEKQSQMVETLATYLECGGHYDASSSALYIHRSTLKYRMTRIRELLGVDLSDSGVRFNLQLATRAWATLGELRTDGSPMSPAVESGTPVSTR